jgi:hypothetical protein
MFVETKQLEGWTFHHTMTITGHRGSKSIEVVNDEKYNSIGGLYAVYQNNQLLYIGEYSNSFQARWLNKKPNSNGELKFRHFKGEYLAEQARSKSQEVLVYVLPLSSIKQQFPDNRWVNQHGIEAELIKHYNPPLNTQYITTSKKDRENG